jgi:hypothetical protein
MCPKLLPFSVHFDIKKSVAVDVKSAIPEPTGISFDNLLRKAFFGRGEFGAWCFHCISIPLSTRNLQYGVHRQAADGGVRRAGRGAGELGA